MHAKSPQSCLTVSDNTDCSLPGSSGHGILQARYWSGLPCPPPGNLPNQGLNLCLLSLLHRQAGSLPLARKLFFFFPPLSVGGTKDKVQTVSSEPEKLELFVAFLSVFQNCIFPTLKHFTLSFTKESDNQILFIIYHQYFRYVY